MCLKNEALRDNSTHTCPVTVPGMMRNYPPNPGGSLNEHAWETLKEGDNVFCSTDDILVASGGRA